MARIDRSGVDIRRLRYFLAVCEHGGFSRAAGAVGIAQPALTRQMQLLEQELGVALFTRNGRSAVPSPAGQVLLAEARAHLESLDGVVEGLRRRFAAPPTPVTLGICPTIAPLFRAEIEAAPGVTVIEAYSGDLRSLMQAGRLDLALSYAPAEAAGVEVTPLLTERLVLATRAPRAEGPVPLDDLPRLRLILPSRSHELRRIVDRVLAARGLEITPALELDSLTAVKAMLTGDGSDHATILPHHAVAAEAAEGRFALHPFADPGMVRTIALLTPATPRTPLRADLTARIARRAEDIRATMEAVA